jgi:hypothetical protein
MNDPQKSVIKLLLYYDIFDHALTRQEIIINCNLNGQLPDQQDILENLVSKDLITRSGELFSVRKDLAIFEKRMQGSARALETMPKALKMARFITRFPFIRSVSLSGSLSKDHMYEKADVDYFIIAQPERLWLARTLLVLYKRIFLLNSYRYFCLNYFVDEQHMEIEQKNLFTATELFTLMPVTGRRFVNRLIEANPWVKEYYPGFPQRDIGAVDKEPRGRLKKTLEWLLNNKLGNALDCMAMKMTIRFWKKKYLNDPNDPFHKSFRLKRYIAKYHPDNFQDLVLQRYKELLRAFEEEKKMSLK